MRSRHEIRVQLPPAKKEAYFPNSGTSEILANEALRRAGDNLVYAIEYGSHVSGDASPTSRHDMMLIVEDTKAFHRKNMELASSEYGRPHSPRFHTFLNRFGFNFYQTTIPQDGQDLRVKYAVISRSDFVKGCNGSLREKQKDGTGAFGFYVAGRMQKAALRPLYKDDERKAEEISQIEGGINTARIDGIWLALGLQDKNFSYDDLLTTYVSLSYRTDLRVEKPGKVQTLIDRSRDDYQRMLEPIINSFVEHKLIGKDDEGFEKIQSLSREEVDKRLKRVKVKTALVNYVKNPITGGVVKGAKYALEKIQRAKQ